MAAPFLDEPRESLADLRLRLDQVDAGLHRLLRERFEIVRLIGAAKGPGEPVIRPAREAAVVENRLAGHKGPLPDVVLVHLWRTIVAAACAVQRPFAVHVAGPLEAAHYLYGPLPVVAHAAPAAAVAALADAPGDVALIPADAPAWWQDRGPAHAILRVPLSDGTAALVLGGADVSRGTGPLALVSRDGAPPVEIATGALTPDDDIIGRYHPFPVPIPAATRR